MNPGYDKALYLLAFDHRGSFERDLFHEEPPVSDEVHARIVDMKNLIFEGFEQAVHRGAPKQAAGVLVDEEFGAAVARKANAGGYVLAMPTERSGQAEFEFEYGEDFASHIEVFDPTFTKVLVRYNPEGDSELNRRQTGRLERLSSWLHDHGRRFLYELLVPATAEQLERCGGNQDRYDAEIRPALVVEAIAAHQQQGVEPDIWKIEGLDTEDDCARVVAQAKAGGRDGVVCIVLGRGASKERVLEWLKVAAPVPGFDGFAVGRTIWEQPLRDLLAGSVTREGTATTIADHYLETIDGYLTPLPKDR
jgi:myo-inositol catabolism protein IolC